MRSVELDRRDNWDSPCARSRLNRKLVIAHLEPEVASGTPVLPPRVADNPVVDVLRGVITKSDNADHVVNAVVASTSGEDLGTVRAKAPVVDRPGVDVACNRAASIYFGLHLGNSKDCAVLRCGERGKVRDGIAAAIWSTCAACACADVTAAVAGAAVLANVERRALLARALRDVVLARVWTNAVLSNVCIHS